MSWLKLPRLISTAGAAAVLVAAAPAAHAFPAFTDKEGKPCAYCHVNPKGAGPRNYRGLFYKKNNMTFAKFDDAAEAKAAGVEIGPNPTPPPKSYTPPDKPAGTPADPADPAKPADPADPTKPADPAKPADPGATTPPEGGPVAEPAKPATNTPTMTVAQANQNYKAAEAAYLKTPKNAARKKSFAEAAAQLGRSTMLDQSIPPARRYPAALRHYRKALSLDPKNKVALADKKQIEDVYKQMGRPVPK